MKRYFHHSLQQDDFSVDDQYQLLRKACPKSGAITIFTGLVRDSINLNNAPKGNIQAIELKTYEAMSTKQMAQVGEDTFKQFDIHGLIMIHRHGLLKPQDQIVFVAAASKHRKEAFSAAEMTMDYLKSKIAFWKKESYIDGAEPRWIEPTESDHSAITKWQK